MPSSSALAPPPVGTLIDDGALELVEILGYGGYGCVYRAVDPRSRSASPKSYAVKCLTHQQSARQRQLHMREISLHRLASAHQNVATLHRVVEDQSFTFIIMDYCPDGDLFTQILHHRRYLGHDRLIKHIFLQLLDAVEHCHSLGIYHRDIKPENVLCLDGGLRIALTDFGLATTDKVSQEFRTGSVYHMSPECQGGRFAPTGSYSPMFNDVWSLGIVLLNLATGRNPWKAATLSDPTFYAYLQSPARFLPSVLPISDALNALLVRTLEVDWRKRITLRELRRELRAIDSLYADDVVFEESLARCAWEAGVDLEGSEASAQEEVAAAAPAAAAATPAPAPVVEEPVVVVTAPVEEEKAESLKSAWSKDSDAAMASSRPASWISLEEPAASATAAATAAQGSVPDWTRYASVESALEPALSGGADADGDRSMSASSWTEPAFSDTPTSDDESAPPSPRSSPSVPPTPRGPETLPARSVLTVDTACLSPGYFDPAADAYDGDSPMISAHSSQMHTAVETWAAAAGAPWAGSFFLQAAPKPRPTSDYAMQHAEDESESETDDDGAHPVFAQELSPSSSVETRMYATAQSSDDSLGHDADVEDADMLGASPVYSPVAASAAAAYPPLFFEHQAAARSPISPAAGKSRDGAKAERRGTGRFNPIRLALRSLSPARRSPSRSKWERTAPAAAATAQHGSFAAAISHQLAFFSSQDSIDQTPKTAPLVDEHRGRTKRSWFAPRRRLFAS